MPNVADKPKKKYTRHGQSLHVYLPPEIRKLIGELAQDNRRDLTAEVQLAIEKHLQEAGRWPPPASN